MATAGSVVIDLLLNSGSFESNVKQSEASIKRLVAKFEELTGQSVKAVEAFDENGKAVKKLAIGYDALTGANRLVEASYKSLRTEMERLSATQKMVSNEDTNLLKLRMAREAEIRSASERAIAAEEARSRAQQQNTIRAQQEYQARQAALAGSTNLVTTSTDRMTSAYQKSQAGFRATNQVVQQASYQITDFVVQVTGGVSAFRAFSQQAPQFLAAFGGAGALIGVFAAIGGAIADLVSKSLDIKTTADRFKDLEDAASAVTTAISMTGKVDLSSLGKNYREATKDGKALIDANVTMSLLMLDMAKIDATATFREGIKQSLADMGFFSRAWNLVVNSAKYARGEESPTNSTQFADIMGITEKQSAEIDNAQMALAQSKSTGAEYIKVLNDVFGSYEKLNPKQKEFYKTQVSYATNLQKQIELEKSLKDAQANGYQGLEKLTDGQKSFIQALKERTEKVEKGEIAMLRMQAAEKKVLAQAEPLLELLTKQEWTREADKYSQSLDVSSKSLEYQNSLLGKSAQEVEVLNNANKIRVDLEKQLIDMKMRLGVVDSEVEAQMRANAEAAIATQTAMITSRQQQEQSAQYGISRAFQSYAEQAGNAAKGMEMVFSNAFKGMEDGLVQFAMTGKMNFTDFANSLISDIMRIYVRMMLVGLAKSAIGAFTNDGSSPNNNLMPGVDYGDGHADGGYTGDGGKYEVAGTVHKGEFVMTKEATSRIGVGNLYRMMRGYASGGYVGTSMPTAVSAMSSAPSGDGVVINIKNEAGGDGYQATANVRKNESGMDIDILVRKALTNDLRGNGPMSQAMSNTFGLSRRA